MLGKGFHVGDGSDIEIVLDGRNDGQEDIGSRLWTFQQSQGDTKYYTLSRALSTIPAESTLSLKSPEPLQEPLTLSHSLVVLTKEPLREVTFMQVVSDSDYPHPIVIPHSNPHPPVSSETQPTISAYVDSTKVQDPDFTPRSEFQQLPKRSTPFGLLSLHGTSSIRGLGFSQRMYAVILDSIKMEWHDGVEYATKNEGDGWKCVLHGNPWRKDGKEELESIRLILAILTSMASHGWMLKDEIQVGASKKDTHSFVFSYKERNQDEGEEVPDFFALTFPLPDRISVVDPPSISTPAIISSIRSAIVSGSSSISSCNPLSSSSTSQLAPNDGSVFTGSSTNPQSAELQRTAQPAHTVKIKREGWVTDGVYSFTIGGYKSLLGGVQDVKYDNSQPNLLLALLHNLDSHHFGLTASIPLLPFKKRRDILFFHSLSSRPLTQ